MPQSAVEESMMDSFPFEQQFVSEAPASFMLIAEDESVDASQPFWVALDLKLQEGWHSYWKNPGDSGMPIQIEWTLPQGLAVRQFKWPYPRKFEQEGLIGYGYEENATFLVEIVPDGNGVNSLEKLQAIDIAANIRWLACSDALCRPGEDLVTLQLPVGEKAANDAHAKLFKDSRGALPTQGDVVAYEQKNGFIELEFKLPHQVDIFAVDFFPEHKSVIDHAEEVLLSSVGTENLQICLKESRRLQSNRLKGVALLHSNTPPYRQAIEIDLPINYGVKGSLVAIADASDGYKANSVAVVSEDVNSTLHEEFPEEFQGGLAMALAFAFLGGAVLNLMPCVLPVISFKVLSFVKMAGESRLETFKHGLAFSCGVIVSFWFLAGAMLLLQSSGQLVGWGFQLQEPLFIGGLAALLLLVALNLFGVFEMGLSITAVAGNLEQGSTAKFSGLCSSFCSGILATALATPCTGPFLGSAVGFAVTQPAFSALLIFTALGVGMSAPYLLLAGFPQLLKFMPKPGAWMVTFKELMGFVMLATVLWLAWVFSAQTNSLALMLLLVAFFLLSIAAWLFGKYYTPIASMRAKLVSGGSAFMLCAAAAYTIVGASSPLILDMGAPMTSHMSEGSPVDSAIAWNSFSPTKLLSYQEEQRPIFIDFTAKWCLICQANHLVLSTSEVQKKFAEKNVTLVKADWTRSDPEITKLLRRYGRNGVPLYLLFDGKPGSSPQILPQVLTPESVLEALKKL